MREIKFEELTTRQKLGMVFAPCLHGEITEEESEFLYQLIRERSLGAVWIQFYHDNAAEKIRKVKEIADYPILIMTDAESGIGDYTVGKHNAIGTTGSEKHAYAFGKVLGTTAKKMGYNVVCNPVLDMKDNSMRSLGTDADKVTALAMAEARGLHDGGVLTVGKHYPGGRNINKIDSHMGESVSDETEESLLNYALKPYIALNEAGLLDGIMASHMKMLNIDDKHPASLSGNVIDIIRKQGYEGFVITDALNMMAICSKYDEIESKALALNGGIDLLLPFVFDSSKQFKKLEEAYEKGLISDEYLDKAVKRVIAAQHKTTLLPKDSEISEEEFKTFNSINKDGIYTKTDEGVSTTLSRDGKHYFIITVKQEIDTSGKRADVDTFSGNGWLDPERISKKIEELFPNSKYQFIHEFPGQFELMSAFEESIGYENVVLMTFAEFVAFTGMPSLTRRLESFVEAMQLTNRISTLIHLGNPDVLEALPHIPNIIFGGHSRESIDTCFEVLAGEYPANGIPTYEVNLK